MEKKMKFNKIILSLSLFTTTCLIANDEVSYDYLGFNYADYGTGNSHNDKVYGLDFSFGINENWYLAIDAERLMTYEKTAQANGLYTKNTYDFSLGFHKEVTDRTDFFAQLGVEHSRVSVPVLYNTEELTEFRRFATSNNNIVGKVGLRTAFNNKFETSVALRTGAKQYPNYQVWSSSLLGGYRLTGFSKFEYDSVEVEAFGLYKFNKSNALKFGLDSVDGYKVGWRYNWK